MYDGLQNLIERYMCRACVFISVGGAVGPLGFIVHNQKVQTRIHVCGKFHDIGGMSGVGNVYWEKLLTFLPKPVMQIAHFLFMAHSKSVLHNCRP